MKRIFLALLCASVAALSGCSTDGPAYMNTKAKRIFCSQVVGGVTNTFEIVGWSNPKENEIKFSPTTGLFSFGSAQNPTAITASGAASALEIEARAKEAQVYVNGMKEMAQIGFNAAMAYFGRPSAAAATVSVPVEVSTNAVAK